MSQYRVPNDADLDRLRAVGELAGNDWQGNVLLDPDGQVLCVLGEPEDRSWWRDGREAVDELNRLHGELVQLRAWRGGTGWSRLDRALWFAHAWKRLARKFMHESQANAFILAATNRSLRDARDRAEAARKPITMTVRPELAFDDEGEW